MHPSNATQAAHLVFNPPLVMPVIETVPTHLRMQIYGDDSGHWLRGRITDANGTAHTINFVQNADFIGWQTVTAALPVNLPLPLTLDRLWMASLGSEETSMHEVSFYNIQVLYAPAPMPDVPSGSRFVDPLMTHSEFAGVAGGFYLSRSAPLGAGEYRFDVTGNTAVVRLSANNNGLDNRNQWEWLTRDVAAHDPTHVIIRMNVNPQNFSQQMFELFHAMLRNFANDGRTVLVVFPGAGDATLTLRDGVRYIATQRISVFADGDNLWWYGN